MFSQSKEAVFICLVENGDNVWHNMATLGLSLDMFDYSSD